MQLTLMADQPLDPWPPDSRRYVAALQDKAGELDALRMVEHATWDALTPLIQIVGHLKERGPYTADTVRNKVKRIYEAVGTHPIYLDILRLRPNFPVQTTSGEVPVLHQIFVAARRRGLCAVPVIWVGSSTKVHKRIVAEVLHTDQHGVALRHKFLQGAVPTGRSRADVLCETLESVSCDPAQADLLLDLDLLDEDQDYDETMIGQSIDELAGLGPFRSVVLLGTTMPKMMSCVDEGTLGRLTRCEWTLWRALRAQGLLRMPAFGDYAVQHPQPPLEASGGNSMRANVRYTVPEETFVARGIGPVAIEGRDQYRELCQMIVNQDEFCGSGYTWGDGVIAACADGSVVPGGQRMWRGAATSHHLRFVTEQLEGLLAA